MQKLSANRTKQLVLNGVVRVLVFVTHWFTQWFNCMPWN